MLVEYPLVLEGFPFHLVFATCVFALGWLKWHFSDLTTSALFLNSRIEVGRLIAILHCSYCLVDWKKLKLKNPSGVTQNRQQQLHWKQAQFSHKFYNSQASFQLCFIKRYHIWFILHHRWQFWPETTPIRGVTANKSLQKKTIALLIFH